MHNNPKKLQTPALSGSKSTGLMKSDKKETERAESNRPDSKTEAAFSPDANEETWQVNHRAINDAMVALYGRFGRMPNKAEIAIETGLSRPTVAKHLQEFTLPLANREQREQLNFMTAVVLEKVAVRAINGDLNAAKLFFDMTTKSKLQNQNCMLRINNTFISQDLIEGLKPEQLKQIEQIIKTSITGK